MDIKNLTRVAKAVLSANWESSYTVPSRTLYPHQWSWDSAFNAIGWAHLDPDAARTELETGLGAQWDDGRIPHIAFNPEVDPDAYFPGPALWSAYDRARDGRATSGIVQPPVHAAAALRISEITGPDPRTLAWLERIYPQLCTWHDYLRDNRTAPGRELVSILHPWESGMDNSPLWDVPLARVDTGLARALDYQRRDLDNADSADRPTDDDYDRYISLVLDYRHGYYDDALMLKASEFVVECPLFNSALAWSELALAQIAELVGAERRPHLIAAAQLTAAIAETLFDAELGICVGYDVRAQQQIPAVTTAGLAPLLLRGIDRPIVETLLATARGRFGLGTTAPGLPSTPYDDESFDANRYWRGPTWVSINWLLIQGLAVQGETMLAESLRQTTLRLAVDAGMYEYFNPVSGEGRGSASFSWTAALALDLR